MNPRLGFETTKMGPKEMKITHPVPIPASIELLIWIVWVLEVRSTIVSVL
jgi:hypothetical protein